MDLTIIPGPGRRTGAELAHWLRNVGEGVPEILQSASVELADDGLLRNACTWLASDLGAVCIAMAHYPENRGFEIHECPPDGPERLEEMARLLRVPTVLTGAESQARRFVVEAIRSRLRREMRNAPPDWESIELPRP